MGEGNCIVDLLSLALSSGGGEGGGRKSVAIKIEIRIEIKIRSKITIKTGILRLFDGEDDLVEKSIRAAMSGDDGELAAPHGNGFGDTVQEALIGVKGEFVESDMAALA